MESSNSGGTVRLGIAGCGFISDWHARAALATDGVSLVACCDVNPDSANRVAKEFGCERAYTDLGEMIDDAGLDAILIATWPVDHRDHILQAIKSGIRWILCEKSLVPGSAPAIEIWKAAKEAGAVVVEGLMWRHHPAMRVIDDLIASGELGELQYVRSQFDFYVPEEASADDPNRNWRQRSDAAGGVPWDVTCYCVDACNRFAGGLPVTVSASTDKSAKYGTVDRLHGWIEYSDGTVGTVSSSFRSNGNYELQVNGQKASAQVVNAWRIDEASSVILRRSTGLFEWADEEREFEQVDAYEMQMRKFIAYVSGGEPLEPKLEESIVNACTVEALVESGAQRSPVEVDIPQDVREALS